MNTVEPLIAELPASLTNSIVWVITISLPRVQCKTKPQALLSK